MAKQAKCMKCKVRYTWDRELGLKRCRCPSCGEPLKGTTYLSHFPLREMGPIHPLGKTRISVCANGQAFLYDWEKNKLRACHWEEKIIKKQFDKGKKDDSIKYD